MNQCSEDRPEASGGDVVAAVDRVAEEYSGRALLRVTVPFIPGVGPAIDAMLGTRGQNIVMARIQRTVDELKAQASCLDERKFDKEYLLSEQFHDLIWRMFEKGQRTADKEKVALYVRVLLGAVQGAAHRENAEEYVNLLSELNPTEIHLAAILFQRHSEAKVSVEVQSAMLPYRMQYGIEPEPLRAQLGLPTLDLLQVYARRLERVGLIEVVNAGLAPSPWWKYTITDYFRNMMECAELGEFFTEETPRSAEE